jgi:hypothetical protein
LDAFESILSFASQQQIATVSDRDLRRIGKTLQEPRKRNFQSRMILRDIQTTGRRLPERAQAKNQAARGFAQCRSKRQTTADLKIDSVTVRERVSAAQEM